MITNLNYPLDSTKRKKSLSRLTWSQIKSITDANMAKKLFTLGDSKDGATLVGFYYNTPIFSLGYLGEGVIRPVSPSSPLKITYGTGRWSLDWNGWYSSSSYAARNGITKSSVLSSLPSDMVNVMKSFTHRYKGYKDVGWYTELTNIDLRINNLYPPTADEWNEYSTYLPSPSVSPNHQIWLGDAYHYNLTWNQSQDGYYTDYYLSAGMETMTTRGASTDSFSNTGDAEGGIVLLFRI